MSTTVGLVFVTVGLAIALLSQGLNGPLGSRVVRSRWTYISVALIGFAYFAVDAVVALDAGSTLRVGRDLFFLPLAAAAVGRSGTIAEKFQAWYPTSGEQQSTVLLVSSGSLIALIGLLMVVHSIYVT